MMKHKASQSILNANEATRCKFISSVIYGVVLVFNGEVKVCSQYEISGSYEKGPVDWAIKVHNMIIVITEAKRKDINQGVGQCTIQLQASIQRNKKHSYDIALREIEMFGIITIASDWVIIKVVSSGVNDNSKVEVLLSSCSPLFLPISEATLNKDLLCGELESLFGQIKWVFNQQIESQGLGK